MSEILLMIVGAAVLTGVAWIVWRTARSSAGSGGDGGAITFYDGTSNSASGSDCADIGGDSGCDGGSGGD